MVGEDEENVNCDNAVKTILWKVKKKTLFQYHGVLSVYNS